MASLSGNHSLSAPLVSVVIGVHNGGTALFPTLQSVLNQLGIEFEVIVVNDGSNDETANILDGITQSDDRLRVFHQPKNVGLTQALIYGCQEARGTYIARQDIGDLSLPNRLAAQSEMLQQHPDVVLCSCWTRAVGPKQEHLGTNCPADTAEAATRKLLDGITGVTHHGAVMFRASAYRMAGGYRDAFYFAQDLDLWYRLLQFGQLAFLPEILYQIQITPRCLSSRYRKQQIALAGIIRQLAGRRSAGMVEDDLLAQAAQIRPGICNNSTSIDTAAADYWIASMLIQQSDARAARYLVSAIRQRPLFLKAWLGFFLLAWSLSQYSMHYLFGNKAHETSAGF